MTDSLIGLLACICFLSRQYVIVPYIPVALAACYASATAGPPVDSDAGRALGRLTAVGGTTFAFMVAFYLISRTFANFG